MKLSSETLLHSLARRDVPLLGGESAVFSNARSVARDSLGRFAKETNLRESYRYFSPYANRWMDMDWHSPIGRELRDADYRCGCGHDFPDLEVHKIYVHNGCCSVGEGNFLSVHPSGLIYGSFAEASKRYPRIVEQWYSRQTIGAEDDFVRRNTLLAEDGVFVYIPRGVRVEHPFQIILTLDAREAQYLELRNLFVVEEQGEASVVFCDRTQSPVPYFTQQVSECFLGAEASLNFVLLQNQHDEALQMHHVYAEQRESSRFVSNAFTVRGGAVRNNIYVTLQGQNARTTCNGLALVDAGQYVDMHTNVRHAVERCESNQLYKTVVDEGGESNFYGVIDVQRGAQKTEAYQRNANLLVSPGAKVHTKPQLIIHADDVKCSHGATVGQFDEESRFYMMQRGLDPEAVNHLLMQGFVEDVIGMLPVAPLQTLVREVVGERLRGKVSSC